MSASVNNAAEIGTKSALAPRLKHLRAQEISREPFGAWLRKDLQALGLWTPVLIALGIGVYFSLKAEPSPFFAFSALAISAVGLIFARQYRPLVWAFAFGSVGFAAADWRAASVAAPILDRETGVTLVTGRVHAVETGVNGQRIVLVLHSVRGLDQEALPDRARITWRGERATLQAGQQISLLASLRGPPPPVAPGGFDFARRLYFERIGAVGFAVSSPEIVADIRENSWSGRLENLRAGLTTRIREAAPGQGGAIVAAVVTGKRDAIDEASRQALRDAGLAHLLAISGLHMGLATGIIFFALRGGLAAIPAIANRYPVKKWAAAAALAAGFAYLLLSGAGWSPRRAFVMTAIIFIAVLADRRALSMRNVAIAATLILLTTPEALFHPGFQMSFAAASALIAGFEWYRDRWPVVSDFSAIARVKRYALGLLATDFLASIATAPFALFHFHRVALYSLAANFIAMPLMAFWIMPAAVIGLLAVPLGIDGAFWRIAALGVDVVLAVGAYVSGRPGAVSMTAQWPDGALIVIVIGGLCLILLRSPLRLAGLASLPIAALMISQATPPDLFVAGSGSNAALVTYGGKERSVSVFSQRRDRFSAKVWAELVGADAKPVAMEDHDASCGEGGCQTTVKGKNLTIIEDPRFLAEDCARADLVVALFPVSRSDWRACAATLIDKRSVWRSGAHAVWLNESGVHIKTVREARGERPWTPERY
ncbi:MAG: ComEC/Rec2 family competence protein [Pseudomonadota bacterium]